MAKIVLTKDISNLGNAGDILEVKSGFARNFLFPRNYATKWTKGVEKHLESIKASRTLKLENDLEAANEIAARINAAAAVQVEVKTTKAGKLYGSVSSKQIVEALQREFKLKLPESSIRLHDHIKELGEYNVEVALHSNVNSQLKLSVVAIDAAS